MNAFMRDHSRSLVGVAAAVVVAGATTTLVQPGSATGAERAAAAGALRGTLTVERGSYFRMLYPGGRAYFRNPDSRARNKSVTLLSAGRNGGLRVGAYQGQPRRGFDSRGNSLAASIIRPASFAGIRFGLATFGNRGPRPSFSVSGRRISGQNLALTAAWNRQYFSQGSSRVRGSYNPRNRRYSISWKSRIRGGPFNGFTGVWRLVGHVR